MSEYLTIGRVKHENVPDYFLARYDDEIAAWAANFDKIGISALAERARGVKIDPEPGVGVHGIVLREGVLARHSPDPEQGRELLEVFLIAKISRSGVEIRPLTKTDADIIKQHCFRMQVAGVPARAQLVEPQRPGLPFMPNVWDPPAPDEAA